MKIDAKAVLLEHAEEQLAQLREGIMSALPAVAELVLSEVFADDRALIASAVAEAEGTAPFVPGPPVPLRDLGGATGLTERERRVVQRSIAGDDDDETPRLPSLAGFVAAKSASDDWGVPVRSTSAPERFGKGAMRGGGGRPHDPHLGREQYALAQRELDRIGRELDASESGDRWRRRGVTGAMQVAMWVAVKGPGVLERRNIHAGRAKRDDVERAEARGKTLKAPARRRAVFVPEREKTTSTGVALELRDRDVFITPHEVGLICREVGRRVREAFEKKGWIAVAKREAVESEGDMATSDYIDGWGEIAKYLRVSERTAKALAKEGLPVRDGLSRGICVKREELDAWQDKRRQLRATVFGTAESGVSVIVEDVKRSA